MIAQFGYGVLVLTFIVTIYSVIAAFIAAKQKFQFPGRECAAGHVTHIPLLSLSALSLIYLLVNNHFEWLSFTK